MNTLVIGDIHGSLEALEDILRRSGAIDESGARVPGWEIFQVGDLLNMAPFGQSYRGFVSHDKTVLENVLERNLIDYFLVGNHELAFTHTLPAGLWGGMAKTHELEPGLLGLIQEAVRNDQFNAATCVHDTLITHAGLSSDRIPDDSDDPYVVADALNDLLISRATHELRYHPAIDGDLGIFWMRPPEFVGTPTPFKQIAGHTPFFGHPLFVPKMNTWYIDSGRYTEGVGSGIVWLEGEDDWKVVPGSHKSEFFPDGWEQRLITDVYGLEI